MLAGVTRIAIVTNPEHINAYKKLLGKGLSLGITIDYVIQENPTGIPDSLLLVPNEYKSDSTTVSYTHLTLPTSDLV